MTTKRHGVGKTFEDQERAFLGTFNIATADRILGLGDQFIENWETDDGNDAEDRYLAAQRRLEWDHYRPLFVSSPVLVKALEAIKEAAADYKKAHSAHQRDRAVNDMKRWAEAALTEIETNKKNAEATKVKTAG